MLVMSYDLNFWRHRTEFSAPPEQTYKQLCRGIEVDGLEDLPIVSFLDRIKEAFPEVEDGGGLLDGKGEIGYFQVSWSPQHVRVDCYGLSGEDMNKFIEIAKEFGCPLYDPQVNTRFDGGET